MIELFNIEQLQIKTTEAVNDYLIKGDFSSAYSVLADYLAEIDLYNAEIIKGKDLVKEFGKGVC